MRSLYDFIVKPIGNRYDNKIKLGDVTLILNTKIEDFKSVNNLAIVVETPKAFKKSIKKGEIIIIHHKVIRVLYDNRGNKKRSRSQCTADINFCSANHK